MSFLCRLRRRRRVVRPRGKLYELTPFKDQVELHRARRVEREFDHHQVRRIIIARSRGTLEHGSVQALWVSLETAHSQEPLRARNHAWNPLSNRIIHSFELRAPLFAPPHKASQTSFTGVRRGNYRRDKVDRVLLCELNYQADELIGLEADNSGSFVVYYDRAAVEKDPHKTTSRPFLSYPSAGTVCRELEWALFSAARPKSARRGHRMHRARPPAPRFLLRRPPGPCFGFPVHFAASVRQAHDAIPPRRKRHPWHPFRVNNIRG